jgi:hypothetical protein
VLHAIELLLPLLIPCQLPRVDFDIVFMIPLQLVQGGGKLVLFEPMRDLNPLSTIFRTAFAGKMMVDPVLCGKVINSYFLVVIDITRGNQPTTAKMSVWCTGMVNIS